MAESPVQPFAISSTYAAEVVARHEVVTLHTTITISPTSANERYPGAYVATLNLPPGFTPLPAVLAALRQQRLISAYSSRPNQIQFDLDRLHAGQRYQFDLRLQATIPGTFQVAPAQLAQRYRTDHRALGQPQQITVTMP